MKDGEKHDIYVPIHIKLEHDGYKPDLMIPDDEENPQVWESTRMVPPM